MYRKKALYKKKISTTDFKPKRDMHFVVKEVKGEKNGKSRIVLTKKSVSFSFMYDCHNSVHCSASVDGSRKSPVPYGDDVTCIAQCLSLLDKLKTCSSRWPHMPCLLRVESHSGRGCCYSRFLSVCSCFRGIAPTGQSGVHIFVFW